MQKTIPFHEVTCVRKAKTAAIFHNAIEIVSGEKKVPCLAGIIGFQHNSLIMQEFLLDVNAIFRQK